MWICKEKLSRMYPGASQRSLKRRVSRVSRKRDLRGLLFCTVSIFIVAHVNARVTRDPTYANPCQLKETGDGLLAVCVAKGLTQVPSGFPNRLTSLTLNSNNISFLTNQSFVGLPLLKNLSLARNTVKHIENYTFFHLQLLQVIIMNDNKLIHLPNNLFVRNQNLFIMHLGWNKLTSIPAIAFRPLKNMKKILLDGNKIQRVNFMGYSPNNVSILSLKANDVTKITIEDFIPLLKTRIEVFDLSRNNLTSLPDHVFRNLVYLTKLKLSHNNFSYFNFSSFTGMTSLQELSMESCGIRDISGFPDDEYINENQAIPPLKILIMRSNNLRFVPSKGFIGLGSLEYLDLRESRIKVIANDSFQGLVSLKTLDLSNNLIESVNPEIFSHMPSLTVLKLSKNKFKILSPKQLQGLQQLKQLDMSLNAINKIKAEYWDVPSLESLDLSRNDFDSLQSTFFLGLEDLSRLIISNNHIKTWGQHSFAGLNNLKSLDLSYLIMREGASSPFRDAGTLISLDLSNSILRSVIKFFRDVNLLQELNLCIASLSRESLFQNNISAFDTLPSLKILALSRNSLAGLNPGTFRGLYNLTKLKLDRCGIMSLPQNIFRGLISLRELYLERNNIAYVSPQHLKHLHSLTGLGLQFNQLKGILDKDLFINNTNLTFVALTNNALTGIATSMYLPMKFLDISKNPLSCTCDMQWFSEYIKNSNFTLRNADKTNCSSKSIPQFVGKSLLYFNPDSACGPKVNIIICTTFLVLLLLIVGALAFRNRWWLNYKFFHMKLLVLGYYEIEDGRENLHYDYDVNIIFADNDEEWVTKVFLEALIDNFPHFARERIVCGDDDLPLGGPRMDAIDDVIENSFKTLAIVSEASVNDAHFMTKLQMVVEHMNEVRLENVVVIFREDVPDNRLPYLVRLFLSKNKTYFRWIEDIYGQRWFWEKLAKLMRANKQMNSLLPI